MGRATATDRLYVDVLIPLPPLSVTQTYTMNIPPAAVVIGGDVAKEDELPYIERLRRSFELQNG